MDFIINKSANLFKLVKLCWISKIFFGIIKNLINIIMIYFVLKYPVAEGDGCKSWVFQFNLTNHYCFLICNENLILNWFQTYFRWTIFKYIIKKISDKIKHLKCTKIAR